MLVTALSARDFRCYERLELDLGPSLTVVTGPNGAGKTNLLEALYFACTGRSCRTVNEREVVRFGAPLLRVSVRARDADGAHELAVGFQPGQPKHMSVDGVSVERLLDAACRPLVSVFLPDRLELVKGAPTLRRAHLDQVVCALRPARVQTRRRYAQALAQRNASLARIRAGLAPRGSIAAWDAQLAGHGIALMQDRGQVVAQLRDSFRDVAALLGLDGEPSVAYRPRSTAQSADELAQELGDRLDGDLERGFTGHGPHRDDLQLSRAGRDLRAYGLPGPAAAGLTGAAAGRARGDRLDPLSVATDAARRRHE